MKKGIFVFILILIADFAIKRWTLSCILPMGGISVFKDFFGCSFSLNFVANKGMAWGFFASHASFLLLFRIFLIAGLLFYLLFHAPKNSQLPITIILAGAVGNVIDSFLYGYVVDMFYPTIFGVAPFAVFNFADAAISFGVAWLALQMYLERKKNVSAPRIRS